MQKPLSLMRDDTIKQLAEVINNSGLSPIIIVPILKDMLSEAQMAMQRQYEIDKQMYEASLQTLSEQSLANE